MKEASQAVAQDEKSYSLFTTSENEDDSKGTFKLLKVISKDFNKTIRS